MYGKFVLAAATAAVSVAGVARAEFAASVLEYERGLVTYANDDDYNDPASALNEPHRIQGILTFGFAEPVNPFAAPYEQDRLVGVGVGGHLTVQLARPVPVNADTRIGIFTNAAIYDPNWTSTAETPARTLAGREYGADRSAEIWVGPDPDNMVSIGRHLLTIPTLSFVNLENSWEVPSPGIPTDFNKPFEGTLSSFDGLSLAEMIALLDGSGGGTWIDVDETALGFDQILYVRIGDPLWLPHDGSEAVERLQSTYVDGPNKYADILVDAINVVPEPSGVMLVLAGVAALAQRRRAR